MGGNLINKFYLLSMLIFSLDSSGRPKHLHFATHSILDGLSIYIFLNSVVTPFAEEKYHNIFTKGFHVNETPHTVSYCQLQSYCCSHHFSCN